jgi:hypothetical protein
VKTFEGELVSRDIQQSWNPDRPLVGSVGLMWYSRRRVAHNAYSLSSSFADNLGIFVVFRRVSLEIRRVMSCR